jgi:chromosome segregation ATPase
MAAGGGESEIDRLTAQIHRLTAEIKEVDSKIVKLQGTIKTPTPYPSYPDSTNTGGRNLTNENRQHIENAIKSRKEKNASNVKELAELKVQKKALEDEKGHAEEQLEEVTPRLSPQQKGAVTRYEKVGNQRIKDLTDKLVRAGESQASIQRIINDARREEDKRIEEMERLLLSGVKPENAKKAAEALNVKSTGDSRRANRKRKSTRKGTRRNRK